MPTTECHNTLVAFGQCFLDTTTEKIGALAAAIGLITSTLMNDYTSNLPVILQSASLLWVLIQIAFSVYRFVRDRRAMVDDDDAGP